MKVRLFAALIGLLLFAAGLVGWFAFSVSLALAWWSTGSIMWMAASVLSLLVEGAFIVWFSQLIAGEQRREGKLVGMPFQ